MRLFVAGICEVLFFLLFGLFVCLLTPPIFRSMLELTHLPCLVRQRFPGDLPEDRANVSTRSERHKQCSTIAVSFRSSSHWLLYFFWGGGSV